VFDRVVVIARVTDLILEVSVPVLLLIARKRNGTVRKGCLFLLQHFSTQE
jgi:hypothetical protein